MTDNDTAEQLWEQYRRARFTMLFGPLKDREQAARETGELFRLWARALHKHKNSDGAT